MPRLLHGPLLPIHLFYVMFSATAESHIPNLSYFFPLVMLISAKTRVPVTCPHGFGHSMT